MFLITFRDSLIFTLGSARSPKRGGFQTARGLSRWVVWKSLLLGTNPSRYATRWRLNCASCGRKFAGFRFGVLDLEATTELLLISYGVFFP